jgi:hypothetical protein
MLVKEKSEQLLKELKDREILLKKIHSKISDQIAKLHMEEVILRRVLYTHQTMQNVPPQDISTSVKQKALREVRDMLHKELGPGPWSNNAS